MTLAAIDVGTNSVKLLVGCISAGRVIALLSRARITRLGEGLGRGKRISPEAAERTLAALTEFRRLAEESGARALAAAGTRALRAASNRAAFLSRCRTEAGVEVRVLSGRDEARLAFRGATGAVRSSGPVAAIDVGGGSTEIMVGEPPDRLRAAWSLPLGAVTLTERFLAHDPPDAEELGRLRAEVRRRLARVPARRAGEILGIGGTASTVLRLTGRGGRASRHEVEALAEHLSLRTAAERERMGVEPGRADIVAAGAWVLAEAMRRLGADHLRAAEGGLRHGILLELASGRWPAPSPRSLSLGKGRGRGSSAVRDS
jgi:exopolyphosphatase/guanosine-5'-triphosphate,3'-diphosphate pyrophosphatase